jgi:hypothetical protein
MNQLARRFESPEVVQEVVTVVAALGDEVRVRSERGEEQARRAVSCLVSPAPGDEVLLACVPDGRLFILAVLERTDRESTEIGVSGQLRIRAAEIDVSASRGNLVFGTLTALAGALVARTEKARFFAGSLDTVCDRLSQTVQRCYRKVAELDVLRAGRLDYRAEQEICLRAENVLAGARKLVKVDGEQIHIG